MTDYHPSVEREFDVGHDAIEGSGFCRFDGHGHHVRVRVTVRGTFDPRVGRSYRVDELEHDLDLLVSELAGKNLAKMMPGSMPTPEGLAVWIVERLTGAHPKITEVVVWLDPQHRFSVTREPR